MHCQLYFLVSTTYQRHVMQSKLMFFAYRHCTFLVHPVVLLPIKTGGQRTSQILLCLLLHSPRNVVLDFDNIQFHPWTVHVDQPQRRTRRSPWISRSTYFRLVQHFRIRRVCCSCIYDGLTNGQHHMISGLIHTDLQYSISSTDATLC